MSQFNIERKNHEALATPVEPNSHAVRNGNALYLSEFTAFGTEAQGKSMEEQANSIFEQIKVDAAAEDTDMRCVGIAAGNCCWKAYDID